MGDVLGIIGSRSIHDWPWFSRLAGLVVETMDVDAIVSGGAGGVDTMAERFAVDGLGFERKVVTCGGDPGQLSYVRTYLAHNRRAMLVLRPDYRSVPAKQAPLRRDDVIADVCTVIHAFWDGESRGTLYTVRRAIYNGTTVVVHQKEAA